MSLDETVGLLRFPPATSPDRGSRQARAHRDADPGVRPPRGSRCAHVRERRVRQEAVATGRVLFERARNATARFEMLALSMYATLQEARRVVLQAYAARRHPAQQGRGWARPWASGFGPDVRGAAATEAEFDAIDPLDFVVGPIPPDARLHFLVELLDVRGAEPKRLFRCPAHLPVSTSRYFW